VGLKNKEVYFLLKPTCAIVHTCPRTVLFTTCRQGRSANNDPLCDWLKSCGSSCNEHVLHKACIYGFYRQRRRSLRIIGGPPCPIGIDAPVYRDRPLWPLRCQAAPFKNFAFSRHTPAGSVVAFVCCPRCRKKRLELSTHSLVQCMAGVRQALTLRWKRKG